VRYELGILYETEGLLDKASGVFLTIPNFLDVPIRLERVRGACEQKGPPESDPAFETDTASPSASERTTVGAGNAPAERKKRRISYL
jgi:hypothetical protein